MVQASSTPIAFAISTEELMQQQPALGSELFIQALQVRGTAW
jgi:hypothetical protein